MSLFPAYQSVASIKVDPDSSTPKEADWTRNESYKIEPVILNSQIRNQTSQSFLDTDKSNETPSLSQHKFSSSNSDTENDEHIHLKKRDCVENDNNGRKRESRKKKRSYSSSSSSSRSRSRSKDRSKRKKSRSSSTSRHSYKKKKKHNKEKYKKKSKDNTSKKNELPQFVPYKTFLEDFNIKDEHELRFAEDRYV